MQLKTNSIEHKIEKNVKITLRTYLPENLFKELEEKDIITQIKNKTLEDLLSFADKDPAAKNSPEYILEAYGCFKAVQSYRIAHALYNLSPRIDFVSPLQIVARKISEKAKATTGIEIHPGAKIGRRFVIDHGHGTVIGETTEIGDDCYLLQDVVLGAKAIAGNQITKRHPTLGNRVEVGGFVSIFGPVTIGDDVKISPRVVIRDNVPANSRVLLLTSNQIIKN